MSRQVNAWLPVSKGECEVLERSPAKKRNDLAVCRSMQVGAQKQCRRLRGSEVTKRVTY